MASSDQRTAANIIELNTCRNDLHIEATWKLRQARFVTLQVLQLRHVMLENTTSSDVSRMCGLHMACMVHLVKDLPGQEPLTPFFTGADRRIEGHL